MAVRDLPLMEFDGQRSPERLMHSGFLHVQERIDWGREDTAKDLAAPPHERTQSPLG